MSIRYAKKKHVLKILSSQNNFQEFKNYNFEISSKTCFHRRRMMYLCGFVVCCKLHSWLNVLARACWYVHGNSAYVAVSWAKFAWFFVHYVVGLACQYLRILSLAPDDATRKRLARSLPANVSNQDIFWGLRAIVLNFGHFDYKRFRIWYCLRNTRGLFFFMYCTGYSCCSWVHCARGYCVQKQCNFVQHCYCTLHAWNSRMCCYGACGSTMELIGSQWDQQTCVWWCSWRNFSFIFIK